MGNCTGVFQSCCGDDNKTIRRVDQDGIKKAMKANTEFAASKFEAYEQ
jgi:hypothetical protein